jgi:type VI protein secretion system component VasK
MKKITMTTNARRDLLFLFFFAILVFILSYYFDIFVFIVRFLERHPRHIIYVDEVIMTLLSLSVGFAVYSWRRWMELRRETAERMRLQEELLRVAETRAETERIISKQLHVEIEQRKQSERNASPAGRKDRGRFRRPL